MPRMGGIELLEQITTTAPNALTVIMTGFGTVETAIDAMKRGAYDYILKPFKVEEVIHVVQRGIEKQKLAAENLRLKEAISLYKVSEAIQARLSLEEVLATVSDTALHELGADLVSTWLDDGQGGYFERQHIATASEIERGAIAAGRRRARSAARSSRTSTRARCCSSTTRRRSASSRSVRACRRSRSSPFRSARTADRQAPRVDRGARFTRNKRFDEGQRKVLAIVGSRAAAAIDNARLYEDLQATFQQTIEGLAKAIDKMDRYTAGHSSRVAMYAVYLAQKLGLGAHDQSRSSGRAR